MTDLHNKWNMHKKPLEKERQQLQQAISEKKLKIEEKLEQMKEIISYSDFIICNKDDAYACAKHLSEQIGISADEKDRETIALAMTKFSKFS